MLTATAFPSLRWILIATAVLGGTALIWKTEPTPTKHRLRLHAVDRPDTTYLSAFRDGDITVEFPTEDLVGLRIDVTADIGDGCRWKGIEMLEPIENEMFIYSYDEEVLSCPPGVTPVAKTPRTGFVSVDD